MLDPSKKINVFIVDDSLFVRMVIKDILHEHPQIEVCGVAMNGEMALRQLKDITPDVITLDVEMPIMNGLETLHELKHDNRLKNIPVIMFSSLTAQGADVTLKALDAGAFDFLQKPEEKNFDVLKEELYTKIIAAYKSRNIQAHLPARVKIPEIIAKKRPSGLKTVVISASTGGPSALNSVIPYIPKNISARILVVQHMPPKFTASLADRLNKISQIEVREAQEGDRIMVNEILIAPGDYHMCVTKDDTIELTHTPTVCGVRPSADVTLESCAQIFGNKVISVILTGMGHDGTNGTKAVKQTGGYCIAQDETTSTIYGMPKSVVDNNLADEIIPLQNIADRIVNLVSK
ncbi:MAG: chemotaxis response regulator protein-glutamate methylesterase [Candidatus Gastranaerophilales bacterium]|nr:chemotaxis response regulator protein-glutamate methylesterase [Candidatus Gastranaerophilales bacterium]